MARSAPSVVIAHVARVDGGLVGGSPSTSAADALDQGRPVAAGQVDAADRSLEEDVAGEQRRLVGDRVGDVAGAVAGGEDDVDLEARRARGVSPPATRLVGVVALVRAEPGPGTNAMMSASTGDLELGAVDRSAGRLGDRGDGADVVEVGVGEQDRLDLDARARRRGEDPLRPRRRDRRSAPRSAPSRRKRKQFSATGPTVKHADVHGDQPPRSVRLPRAACAAPRLRRRRRSGRCSSRAARRRQHHDRQHQRPADRLAEEQRAQARRRSPRRTAPRVERRCARSAARRSRRASVPLACAVRACAIASWRVRGRPRPAAADRSRRPGCRGACGGACFFVWAISRRGY